MAASLDFASPMSKGPADSAAGVAGAAVFSGVGSLVVAWVSVGAAVGGVFVAPADVSDAAAEGALLGSGGDEGAAAAIGADGAAEGPAAAALASVPTALPLAAVFVFSSVFPCVIIMATPTTPPMRSR